jgi:hypothetical protein
MLKALIERDVICKQNEAYACSDPWFREWVRREAA